MMDQYFGEDAGSDETDPASKAVAGKKEEKKDSIPTVNTMGLMNTFFGSL